ncbi:Zn-dependent hydrolase [Pseudalkalibacillus sp. SCS-8]|uniref:Zn-dependent hydrolase n=1 Tax=Pseudalkalibacillus nanhaiensis TaxID=3115291 RepID=UPI0032DAF970
MTIQYERFKSKMEKMAEIGKTENGGVHRLALSDTDKKGREQYIAWLKDLNLDVRVDDFGNIFARKEGREKELPPVVLGSHLDSVPYGGKFDGTLGVIAALEVVEAMVEADVTHDHPIEIVNFTNEEGARFPTPMLGSGGMTDVFTKEHVYTMKDDDGISYYEELERIGFLGEKENRLTEAEAFIELHIEQGPVLEEKELPLAIVEGIQGVSWHRVTFTGQADHAGTTPMKQRKDALMGAVHTMSALHQWVRSIGDETALTFGKISVKPSSVNVIPGEATFTVDLRHPDGKTLEERVKRVKEIIEETAEESGCGQQIEDLSYMAPVKFSDRLIAELEEVVEAQGLTPFKMHSGAGHDAMYMNRIAETVMLFVPSVDGKSHCEEEITHWEDLYRSLDVLYAFVKKISTKKVRAHNE